MSVEGRNLDEDEVVESNSYSEGCVPSPTRLAQVNKVAKATQCDRSWWYQRCTALETPWVDALHGWSVLSLLQNKGIMGKTKRRSNHK